ncbi:isocitrate lyase/phosphoenolpyruvate mutase family protein [Reyranella sp. CPCC 100927]|uniref:isocitrate lyase/PEP mutase family protein n=1 Tax=Reyranella sp. CPCC 100927 TaxID=2599616 RepID=UPI0011B42DA7|nr:isocitrate lyase/phosphoenolpyruvate mutase family protein [Reyranella sp. CPCC 100927]TWT14895.1 isocitrate lyase/phosphoenolpyruvate mutase family protein [Reyranella sp. CPCC 100927]
MTTPSQAEKAAHFAKLHDAGCFILPNAWDMPSAALIVEAGYGVLATTSAGVAFAQGLPDGEHIGRDRMLAVAGEIARRVPVPVSADLEAGYGAAPKDVAETVRRAIAAGLVGCNIEDSDPATHKLLDFDQSVARIKAGAEAARAAGLPDFVLNARTDPFLVAMGTPEQNVAESVRRANAFLTAGAHSAFVPGPVDAATIGTLVKAIKGPLNVMAVARGHAPPLAELRGLGVRRVSLGGSLMSATYGFALHTLKALGETGTFDYAAGSGVNHGTLTAMMRKYV